MLSPRRPHKAFTLIELLVVIAIIAVIAGLAIFAAAKMREQGQAEQSKVVVNAAANVLAEYQAQTDRVPYFDATPPYSDPEESIRFFLNAARSAREADGHLQTINRDFVIEEEIGTPPEEEVVVLLDAWGHPIRYSWVDDGGTPGDYTDDWFGAPGDPSAGMPRRRMPYFASAGPDGLFGEWNVADDLPVAGSGAEDNIYSFDQE